MRVRDENLAFSTTLVHWSNYPCWPEEVVLGFFSPEASPKLINRPESPSFLNMSHFLPEHEALALALRSSSFTGALSETAGALHDQQSSELF